MAALTVGTIDRDGLALGAVAAASGGDTFANTGVEFLYIKNGGGGSITLTFVTSITIDGQAVGDRAVTVTAAAENLYGPFPTNWYSSTVSMTYSAVTSVTVRALKLGS